MSVRSDEDLARLFHETYERLAPFFSYTTRKASAVPWGDVPPDNKRLMIAVCGEVRAAIDAKPRTEAVNNDLISRLESEAASMTLAEFNDGFYRYPEHVVLGFMALQRRAATALETAHRRIDELEARIIRAAEHIDCRSELYTNDADLLASLLATLQPKEQQP